MAVAGRSRPVATAALALAATLVALGMLEVGLRVAGVDPASAHAIGGFTVYDPVLGWRLAPDRDATFRTPSFATRVVHGPTGLRGRPHPEARTPGRRRLLVLGDSFVWCWGVPMEQCFTERLEVRLGAEVVNAGVPAYSTAQELLFYERDLRRYRPDAVVLVVVPNDPFENAEGYGPRFRLANGALVAPTTPVRRRKSVAGEWLQAHSRLWAQTTYLAAVLRDTVRMWRAAGVAHAADGPGYTPDTALPSEKSWALTEALLDRLAADVRADGARFAVVLEEMPEPMIARLRAWAAARAVPCLPLGPAFTAARERGVRVRLRGDPHVGPDGQAVVADALARFLDETALLR